MQTANSNLESRASSSFFGWSSFLPRVVSFFLGTVSIVGLLSNPAGATLILTGANVDRDRFLFELQIASNGVPWVYDATGRLQIMGPTTNYFAEQVDGFARNGAVQATLDVGRNQPNVVVGAFARNGLGIARGTQRLDLADIRQFPAADFFVDLRAAVILHEISEVFNAVRFGRTTPTDVNRGDYDAMHNSWGLVSEGGELRERGHRWRPGELFGGGAASKARPDVCANCEDWILPWFDTLQRDMDKLILTLDFGGAPNVRNIAPGFRDSGAGLETLPPQDIQVLAVRFEGTVPEPSTFALAFLALTLAASFIRFAGASKAL